MAFGFDGRLGIVQRVLPPYRAAFFDLLAESLSGGVGVFAGLARPGESIAAGTLERAGYTRARNFHLFGGPFYLCWQAGLLSWLEKWDPGALIVVANPRYLSTPSALRWMKHRGRPVIGWGLGSPAPSGALAGLRRSRRGDFLDRVDALIAYSRRGADEYAALGFPGDKIFVAPNAAVRCPTVPPPPRPPAFINGRPTVLFVGRLQARKRLDVLLRACAELEKRASTGSALPTLVIVGDGPERAGLESLARQIYPSAEFPGAKHGADLAPYFAAADLFVLPGTGGLAIQQAMSAGLPVLVAQADGTQSELVRPENGWVLPPNDDAALANVLAQALADVGRLRRMGEESYRIVAEEVNVERMVEVFAEVVRRI